MDKSFLGYNVVLSLIIIFGIIIGIPVNYPDNVHIRHGLPFTWGVHQRITIAGPVDTWIVNVQTLALDLVLWFGVLILGSNWLFTRYS